MVDETAQPWQLARQEASRLQHSAVAPHAGADNGACDQRQRAHPPQSPERVARRPAPPLSAVSRRLRRVRHIAALAPARQAH